MREQHTHQNALTKDNFITCTYRKQQLIKNNIPKRSYQRWRHRVISCTECQTASCVYIYIYTYIYVCMYVCMYVHMHEHAHNNAHIKTLLLKMKTPSCQLLITHVMKTPSCQLLITHVMKTPSCQLLITHVIKTPRHRVVSCW